MGKTFIMLHILQQPQTLLTALKEQVNLGQLATETCNWYSAHNVTVNITVNPVAPYHFLSIYYDP